MGSYHTRGTQDLHPCWWLGIAGCDFSQTWKSQVCTQPRQAHLHLFLGAKYNSTVYRAFILFKLHLGSKLPNLRNTPFFSLLHQKSKDAHLLSSFSMYKEIMKKAGPQEFLKWHWICLPRKTSDFTVKTWGYTEKNNKKIRERSFSGLEPEPCNKDSPFCSHLF